MLDSVLIRVLHHLLLIPFILSFFMILMILLLVLVFFIDHKLIVCPTATTNWLLLTVNIAKVLSSLVVEGLVDETHDEADDLHGG